MASKMAIAGNKRHRDPSVQGLKVRFLINIPLKVDSEDEAQKRCRYLLDALDHQGFNKSMTEDQSLLEDVAVIFGMNCKYSPDAVQVLKRLETFRHSCRIKHSIITYTWGSDGTIAHKATTPPFQNIREYLKNNAATTKLAEELRRNDQSCLLYFSFVDSDTIFFNTIYSEYLQIVRDELKKDNIPPTVMSTGYEFHRGSKYHIASWLDRLNRVGLAKVNPLHVYYPEPNFCILVHDKLNTIQESFIQTGRVNMESSVLISKIKKRVNFKAVFSEKEPVTICVPERFKLSKQGLQTGQSTLDGRNLAICVYCNGLLTNEEKIRGIAGKNRGYIMKLYNCETDEDFEKLRKIRSAKAKLQKN